MDRPVRVARVDELPPGKGKRVEIGGREVLVYNAEGRLRAQALGKERPSPPGLPCAPPGAVFEVTVEDSPSRLDDHVREYKVAVEGDYVFVGARRARS